MSVEILTTENFRREAKRLIKKYPSIKNDLVNLQEQLFQNPRLGIPLGWNCYKIRMAIKSKGKGKSGGARIITHLMINPDTEQVYLMSIYDKSEFDSISDKDLKRIISEIKEK
ncbi:hypothetical protein L0Z72_11745 [candidate division KSB1 bacterium]|nr:hypothetical protein [candidate division KSB1 bacterium]